MNITVSGKQTKIGLSLKTYVQENILFSLNKYFENHISANILFSKDTFNFKCEISLHIEKNIYVNSNALSNEAYGAFNIANEKIKKRLRRYHRKLVNHRQKKIEKFNYAPMDQYIIKDPESPKANREEIETPVIIAENKVSIQDLSVSEALMLMNLKENNALLFRNSKTKKINLLHKRPDGNIGWLDTKLKK